MRAHRERVEGDSAEVAGEHGEVDVPPAPRRKRGRPKVGEGAYARQKESMRKAQVDVEYAPIIHRGWVEVSEFGGMEFNDGTFPRALASKQGVQIPVGTCSRCRRLIHNTADNRATHRAWCRRVTMDWKRGQRAR